MQAKANIAQMMIAIVVRYRLCKYSEAGGSVEGEGKDGYGENVVTRYMRVYRCRYMLVSEVGI